MDSGHFVQSGICTPFEYWGGPLTVPPTNKAAGEPTKVAGGSALTGKVCPSSGRIASVSSARIAQTDDRSGGQTVTEVPNIASTSPRNGETMHGAFTARAGRRTRPHTSPS